MRRKARGVRSVVRSVVRRFKEGRPYVADLFAGNYMFMQVSPSAAGPTTFKSYLPAAGSHFYAAAQSGNGLRLNQLPARVVS